MKQAPFLDRQRFVIWLINRVSDRGYKYNLCPSLSSFAL
jgi:hypothetical protein